MKISDPIVFRYLMLPNGLGGRGAVTRFFFLANNIPFTEDNVSMADWGAGEKVKSIESGENPCGTLPILYVGDKQEDASHVIQHIAMSRFIARLHGVTKDMTPYEEYVQDLVADEYQGFRDMWVSIAVSSSDEETL